jgi:hypothetical protein
VIMMWSCELMKKMMKMELFSGSLSAENLMLEERVQRGLYRVWVLEIE